MISRSNNLFQGANIVGLLIIMYPKEFINSLFDNAYTNSDVFSCLIGFKALFISFTVLNPHITKLTFQCSAKNTIRLTILLSHRSSLSTNIIYFPVAASIPAFLAELTPPFVLCIALIRLSSFSNESQIDGDASFEPSSTKIISILE